MYAWAHSLNSDKLSFKRVIFVKKQRWVDTYHSGIMNQTYGRDFLHVSRAKKISPAKSPLFFTSGGEGGDQSYQKSLVFARAFKVPLIFEALESLVRFWRKLGLGARSHIFAWFGQDVVFFRSCVQPVENPTFCLLVRSAFAIWMGRRTKKHKNVRGPTHLTQSKFPRCFEALLNQFDEDSS